MEQIRAQGRLMSAPIICDHYMSLLDADPDLFADIRVSAIAADIQQIVSHRCPPPITSWRDSQLSAVLPHSLHRFWHCGWTEILNTLLQFPLQLLSRIIISLRKSDPPGDRFTFL
jgi:hypothetical protein